MHVDLLSFLYVIGILFLISVILLSAQSISTCLALCNIVLPVINCLIQIKNSMSRNKKVETELPYRGFKDLNAGLQSSKNRVPKRK